MNWVNLLKSLVCVLNLAACVRLVGPYMFPTRSGERSEGQQQRERVCRLAFWIGVLAYSYGLGHALMRVREGWTGVVSGVDVILLMVQVLNLLVWTYLLVRTHGGSL